MKNGILLNCHKVQDFGVFEFLFNLYLPTGKGDERESWSNPTPESTLFCINTLSVRFAPGNPYRLALLKPAAPSQDPNLANERRNFVVKNGDTLQFGDVVTPGQVALDSRMPPSLDVVRQDQVYL